MGAVTISLSAMGIGLCVVGICRDDPLFQSLGVFCTMLSFALSFL